MGGAYNGIKMNNAHMSVTMADVLRLNDPQPGGAITFRAGGSVPVYKSAWIVHTSK
jgi:hypothetical protein